MLVEGDCLVINKSPPAVADFLVRQHRVVLQVYHLVSNQINPKHLVCNQIIRHLEGYLEPINSSNQEWGIVLTSSPLCNSQEPAANKVGAFTK